MIAAGLFACTAMDHTYKDFWKEGEQVYPAPVDSVKSYPGKNRIDIEWTLKAGADVAWIKVYWNNKSDSLVLPVNTVGQTDTIIRISLDNMQEGTYAFTVYTFDSNGNRSVPSEITGTIVGEAYERMLLIRLVEDAYYEDGKVIVVWGNPVDDTSFGSELIYQAAGDETHTALAPPQSDTLKIEDYAGSGTFEYRTGYLPAPGSLDTFYTAFRTVEVKLPIRELDKTGWTVTASSYDTRYPAGNPSPRTAEMAIDGSFTTRWVNQISPQLPYPHWLAVDIQTPVELYGIVLHGGNNNETPSLIEIWVSEDGVDWTSKGTYSVLKNQNQYFEFEEPQVAQHVKVECKAPSGGNTPNTNIYELGVYTRSI
jgi:hypothetical protein